MMVKQRRDHRFAVDMENLQRLADQKVPLISYPFRHRDLFGAVLTSPVIGPKALINSLHHIHFTNGSLLLHVNDPKHGEDYLVEVQLEDCLPGRSPAAGRTAPPKSGGGHVSPCHPLGRLSLILLPIEVSAKLRGDSRRNCRIRDTCWAKGWSGVMLPGHRGLLTQSGFLARAN